MRTPLLHQAFPELRSTLPHLALGATPTTVRPLPGLTDGTASVWLKDDGEFGDGGWGGNKVRKLEWLLADAKHRGRQTILTVGGLGTNWGLATALYGREHGLSTVLALVDQPVDEHVRAQLGRLRDSGARLYFTRTKARTIAAAPLLLGRYTTGGRLPYLLPAGGSSPLGALGYVETAFEIGAQVRAGKLPEPSHVVVAMGSGGTVAGLQLGLELAGLATRVVGVVVNDTLRLDAATISRLAARTRTLLRRRGAKLPAPQNDPDRLRIVQGWMGQSYGHPTPAAGQALRLAEANENLHLEPVYTAKALAALLEMNHCGEFGAGPILYLNTNGPR
ncbi:1-aminocyclopropane-1-carboxylate deaminase/D-cysteine desulfhydrase [Nocardia tengchongensis]